MTRRGIIGVLLVGTILLAVGYYSYYLGAEEQYRQSSLNELDGLANARKGLGARSEKILARMAGKSKVSDSDLDAMFRVNEESAALRRKFLALENRIKARNNGVLPQWLKDDRNWQQLDRVYGRLS